MPGATPAAGAKDPADAVSSKAVIYLATLDAKGRPSFKEYVENLENLYPELFRAGIEWQRVVGRVVTDVDRALLAKSGVPRRLSTRGRLKLETDLMGSGNRGRNSVSRLREALDRSCKTPYACSQVTEQALQLELSVQQRVEKVLGNLRQEMAEIRYFQNSWLARYFVIAAAIFMLGNAVLARPPSDWHY